MGSHPFSSSYLPSLNPAVPSKHYRPAMPLPKRFWQSIMSQLRNLRSMGVTPGQEYALSRFLKGMASLDSGNPEVGNEYSKQVR